MFINNFLFFLFSSNVVYYPLTQQSTLQQPVYLTPTSAGTGTTWPSNLFSQFSLANLSAGGTTNTNVSTALNTGNTTSPQTVYEVQPALFESATSSTGQQLYWPSYN